MKTKLKAKLFDNKNLGDKYGVVSIRKHALRTNKLLYLLTSMRILKIKFLILMLSGCVTAPHIKITEDSSLNEIKGLNRCNFSLQCKKIHTGFNPCGAHTGYLLYSTLIGSENIKNLKLAVVKNRIKEEEAYFARTGGSYECQSAFTLWPSPVCSHNTCVIK